jgi:hypothetical protein
MLAVRFRGFAQRAIAVAFAAANAADSGVLQREGCLASFLPNPPVLTDIKA